MKSERVELRSAEKVAASVPPWDLSIKAKPGLGVNLKPSRLDLRGASRGILRTQAFTNNVTRRWKRRTQSSLLTGHIRKKSPGAWTGPGPELRPDTPHADPALRVSAPPCEATEQHQPEFIFTSTSRSPRPSNSIMSAQNSKTSHSSGRRGSSIQPVRSMSSSDTHQTGKTTNLHT